MAPRAARGQRHSGTPTRGARHAVGQAAQLPAAGDHDHLGPRQCGVRGRFDRLFGIAGTGHGEDQ